MMVGRRESVNENAGPLFPVGFRQIVEESQPRAGEGDDSESQGRVIVPSLSAGEHEGGSQHGVVCGNLLHVFAHRPALRHRLAFRAAAVRPVGVARPRRRVKTAAEFAAKIVGHRLTSDAILPKPGDPRWSGWRTVARDREMSGSPALAALIDR